MKFDTYIELLFVWCRIVQLQDRFQPCRKKKRWLQKLWCLKHFQSPWKPPDLRQLCTRCSSLLQGWQYCCMSESLCCSLVLDQRDWLTLWCFWVNLKNFQCYKSENKQQILMVQKQWPVKFCLKILTNDYWLIKIVATYFTVDQLKYYCNNCFSPDSDKVMKTKRQEISL